MKLHTTTIVNKGKLLVFSFCIVLIGCVGARQTIQIPDYILVPKGKEIVENQEGLTAFIFENNTKNLPIEKFLSIKFKSENYFSTEYWVVIDKSKYKMIVYDNSDFEKYFNSANYSVINLEPQNDQSDQQRKFIAISMVNANNEDCLKDGSLFQNIVVNYLKKLKDEYYNQ
ncbi:hypothetical protein [Flavobacterium sp.]|uniref:hypothetical protein n=1 Tax=Flavobacterium sp. TaxID=239 RepID=UPI002634A12E|nr:hypothetical protein [Flavobacterium sp.]